MYPYEWVLLVIQCLLYAPKNKEDVKRHSICKAKCIINERVCDVIIDSSSSENMVSKTIVDKL